MYFIIFFILCFKLFLTVFHYFFIHFYFLFIFFSLFLILFIFPTFLTYSCIFFLCFFNDLNFLYNVKFIFLFQFYLNLFTWLFYSFTHFFIYFIFFNYYLYYWFYLNIFYWLGWRRGWVRCVDFPDGAAAPFLRQCYRWLFGSAKRQCCCWSTTRNCRAADNPPFPLGRHEKPQYPSTMADRENLVYQAKLAEQAERYDGKAADRYRWLQTAWPLVPPLSPCAGGLETQVKQFTWICWVRRDKMAEVSPAEWNNIRLNVVFSSRGRRSQRAGKRVPRCALLPANICVSYAVLSGSS